MRVKNNHPRPFRIHAESDLVQGLLYLDQTDKAGRAVGEFGNRDRDRGLMPVVVGHDRIEPLAHTVRSDQQDQQQADGRQQVEPAIGAAAASDRGFCAWIHDRQSAVRFASSIAATAARRTVLLSRPYYSPAFLVSPSILHTTFVPAR